MRLKSLDPAVSESTPFRDFSEVHCETPAVGACRTSPIDKGKVSRTRISADISKSAELDQSQSKGTDIRRHYSRAKTAEGETQNLNTSVLMELIDAAPRISKVKRSRALTERPSAEPDASTDGERSEKVFTCPFRFCSRPFRRLEHLKRHVRTHTRERPFECRHCSRAFSRRDNLLQHERIHERLGNTPVSLSQEVAETPRSPSQRSATAWLSPVGDRGSVETGGFHDRYA
jgi:hypothetical protein